MDHQQSNEEDAVRRGLLEITDGVRPLREFVLGEVAYYERQGFTMEQSRAMAAAEFTSIFGLRIATRATLPEDDA